MITGNMGELMPFNALPVLPGDTVQMSSSALIRVSPLNTPVMHPVAVRIHHFFVPNRLTMPEWEDFITGGDGQAPAPTIPTIPTTGLKKDLMAYLGLPPIAGVDVSALPIRAANLCFNEWYRDQDLVPERLQDDTTVPRIAWEKDCFGVARPWTQKGPDVTLPTGDTAPVIPTDALNQRPTFQAQNASAHGGLVTPLADSDVKTDNSVVGGLYWDDPALIADLSSASAPSVNDWRAAFSLQRYQEARARYGSRFTEYLRYLGIRPSDARLQRPEYLGGGSARLQFSEVLQTAPGTDRPNGPPTDPNGS